MNEAIQSALTVLSTPAAQLVIATLILALLPEQALARIPVIGPLVGLALTKWSQAQLAEAAQRQLNARTFADVTVQALQQDIKVGRVDQATARNLAIKALMDQGLELEEAARSTEAAVHRLGSGWILGETLDAPAAAQ